MDAGREFGGWPGGQAGFGENQGPMGAFHEGGDGVQVERLEGPQVEDGHIEIGGGFQGKVLGGAVGEDRGFRSVLAQRGVAEARRGRGVPGVLQAAVERLVFQEEDRVGVLDAGAEQGVGVRHRAGRDDLEAGAAEEVPFGVLAMEGPAVDARADRAAEHDGAGCAPAPMGARGEIADEVGGQQREIHELELGNGSSSHERRADGRARDGLLGDGRVQHSSFSELFKQPLRRAEGPAVHADVFAEAEDGRIRFHRVVERGADRIEVGAGEHGHASAGIASKPRLTAAIRKLSS